MGKVRLLSEKTINQIAAGEVVEDPASVVKELVENAIDAKSTSICVDILGGGMQSICVTDDGEGMSPEDALLALQRHATSKITKFDDLFSLQSMGFRGEALAAIASISKLRLSSACRCAAQQGIMLFAQAGKLEQQKTARLPGTTVEVQDLFYNVPARRQFQVAPARSTTAIVKLLTLFAMVHVNITFQLTAKGKTLLFAKKGSLESRVAQLLSPQFLEQAKFLTLEQEGITISGYVGKPEHWKKSRSRQYLFLNQRIVTCPEIQECVYAAYGTMLGTKEHPAYLLFIEVPPHFVDVNVHPQKKTVRLKEPHFLCQLLVNGIQNLFYPKISPGFAPSDFSFERTANCLPEGVFQDREALPTSPPGRKEIQLAIPDWSVAYVWSKYALLENIEGLHLVHLRRAFARIHFCDSKKRQWQRLLLPKVFEFSKEESLLVQQSLDLIKGTGIGIRSFGEQCFVVDSIASDMPEKDVEAFVESIVRTLQTKKVLTQKQLLAMLPDRFVGPSTFSEEEGKLIIKTLLDHPPPYYCPRGNPIIVRMTDEKIIKCFDS